jgi:hypothetical protein
MLQSPFLVLIQFSGCETLSSFLPVTDTAAIKLNKLLTSAPVEHCRLD